MLLFLYVHTGKCQDAIYVVLSVFFFSVWKGTATGVRVTSSQCRTSIQSTVVTPP